MIMVTYFLRDRDKIVLGKWQLSQNFCRIYTNSLVNADLIYVNFSNNFFQKVPISYSTHTTKFALSENMRSGYF